MHIRTLTAADYPAVDALMAGLHALHVTGRPDLYVPMEHIYSREYYESLLTDHIALGTEIDGVLAGLCICEWRKRTCMVNHITAYMDDLVVAEPYRGRGVATALFHAAEKAARAGGAIRLDLMVWDFNQDAMAFYKAMGMTPQRYIMEKKL